MELLRSPLTVVDQGRSHKIRSSSLFLSERERARGGGSISGVCYQTFSLPVEREVSKKIRREKARCKFQEIAVGEL